jgi:cytochrome bd-type quinol oxidase subunit 2
LSKWRRDFSFTPGLIIALTLSAGITFPFVKQRPIRSRLWRRHFWLVFTQLLFYPLLIVVAVLVGVNYRPVEQGNDYASWIIDAIPYVSLVIAGFWIWRMKGLRWLAFCLVLLQQLLVVGAYIVADMSISVDGPETSDGFGACSAESARGVLQADNHLGARAAL